MNIKLNKKSYASFEQYLSFISMAVSQQEKGPIKGFQK